MSKWFKRGVLGIVLIAAVAGGYVGYNWSTLKVESTGREFRATTAEADRTRLAGELLAAGEPGAPYLLEPFQKDDAESCAAVVGAMVKFLGEATPSDPRHALWCRAMLEGYAGFSEVGKAAAVELVPELLRSAEPTAKERCREVVKGGLNASNPEARVRSIRMAMRPEINAKASIVALLDAPQPEVRRAAMLAVGPDAAGLPAIGDEELFRWLHDADTEVRDLCASALNSRGLDSIQVLLAKQLTDPNPAERLKLLTDLKYMGDAIKDPGPWLERLSRDADPAVRLGAARVAVESRLEYVAWIDRLGDRDPDPTVRKWAKYYRTQAAGVRQAELKR